MTRSDLHRVHAVTDNFFFWQGLRWVPLGVALMVIAVTLNPAVPIAKAARPWIGLPFILIGLWLSTSVLGGYYARTFGRVHADPARHATRSHVKWLLAYPVMFLALLADAVLTLPILVSGPVFGFAIEAYRQSTGGGRPHYTAAAIICAIFGLLPLTGLFATGSQTLGAFMGLFGAIYAIGGVLDHLELVRVLGSAAATPTDG